MAKTDRDGNSPSLLVHKIYTLQMSVYQCFVGTA